MYTESYLRYLLSDDASLQQYYVSKKRVSLRDIKRNLMLIERENNRHIPDHYYRLGQERSFDGITMLSEVFTVGLCRLSEDYLELRGSKVCVKAEKMNSWQMMLPYMPPLLMVCTKLWKEYVLEDGREMEYIHAHLLPNMAYTTYPSPYIPQLEDFLEDGGLTDLHMHLNGALETDLTWQDFLNNPMEIKAELDKAIGHEKVKEQYAQTSLLADPEMFYRLLRIASVLRYMLYGYVYGIDLGISGSLEKLLADIADGELFGGSYPAHPMELMLGKDVLPQFMEGVLYIKILQEMNLQSGNDTISTLFHYYLLILGMANKMMVQQTTCYGFEEFQKVTLNGLREYSEAKDYYKRFAQLSGNELRHVKLLEGRFSPKNEQSKNEQMLSNILDGWERLRMQQRAMSVPESSLKLVAHFIKKTDDGKSDFIRYKNFRDDIDHRADLLIQLLVNNHHLSNVILGIDAAASEFDTPPEVFAPAYRKLRNAGFHHFTYHAGEDFFHVLSGLRAIYEAIMYLDLQRCDRIGHATAAGVPINLWLGNVGNKMLIRQGEHLDNLIFAYHMISEKGDKDLKELLPMLSLKIDAYSHDVYDKYYPVSIHMKAWKERYNDPMQVMAEGMATGDGDTEMDLFIRYHRSNTVKQYNKIIEIDTLDVLNESQLIALQQLLLKEMHDKEIVIETLPTSNVIIGNHHDFSTYHLYSWFTWMKEGKPLPPIVVGTDDIGIFATNIYNEYCNIYCQFLYEKYKNSDVIIDYLKKLNDNARHYSFRN